MGLADAINETLNAQAKRLKVDVMLEQMDADDAAALDVALRDLTLTAGKLSEALRRNGTPITENPIHEWRRRNLEAAA
ncbi:hypothetical protein [Ilumatobacter sp.]|uniref:hypothetical protein n=1 Tax=Ilumatobacter sp. TaxID=1967498 RepID=UPI003752E3E2